MHQTRFVMVLFDAALLFATLLCALVAGFLFAFAVVAMPGDVDTQDGDALRAARAAFGGRRNRWSAVRTAMASVVAVPIILLLVRDVRR